MVYLVQFLSYLAVSKSVSARPSDPDTMTNTSYEATASTSGKNGVRSVTNWDKECGFSAIDRNANVDSFEKREEFTALIVIISGSDGNAFSVTI